MTSEVFEPHIPIAGNEPRTAIAENIAFHGTDPTTDDLDGEDPVTAAPLEPTPTSDAPNRFEGDTNV